MTAAADVLVSGGSPKQVAAAIEKAVAGGLVRAAMSMRDYEDYFLATLLVLVATPEWVSIWTRGDGAWRVGDNEPNHIDDLRILSAAQGEAYRLPVECWDARRKRPDPGWLEQRVELRAHEVPHAWIATDGARFMRNTPPTIAALPWQAARTDLDNQISAAVQAGSLRDDFALFGLLPRT